MPFNGSGVFTIINTFVPGTTIFSSAVNANFSDIATGLTTVYAFQRTPAPSNLARRNGGMEIWQRGAGGSASIAVGASTTAYTCDGWYLVTGANQACVVSQQAGITDDSQWCARVQRNSGQTGTGSMTFGFPFDTDEIYPLLGQYACLSLTLKAGANWSPASGNLAIALNVGTGTPVKFTAGYTGATISGTLTQAISVTAARYQFTTAAIIPTTTRQMEITLTWTPVGTAGVNDHFSIDDVQIEAVTTPSQAASPFDRKLFEEQLLLCQRHFQKTFPYGTAPAASSLAAGYINWTAITATRPSGFSAPLPVKMRLASGGTGTAYNYNAAGAEIRNVTNSANWTGTSCTQLEDGISVGGTPDGGMVAGNTIAVHATVDAGI